MHGMDRTKLIKCNENPSSSSRQMDGDMATLTVAFRSFATAPENERTVHTVTKLQSGRPRNRSPIPGSG
jgi:hypothetical protein